MNRHFASLRAYGIHLYDQRVDALLDPFDSCHDPPDDDRDGDKRDGHDDKTDGDDDRRDHHPELWVAGVHTLAVILVCRAARFLDGPLGTSLGDRLDLVAALFLR